MARPPLTICMSACLSACLSITTSVSTSYISYHSIQIVPSTVYYNVLVSPAGAGKGERELRHAITQKYIHDDVVEVINRMARLGQMSARCPAWTNGFAYASPCPRPPHRDISGTSQWE